MHTFQGKPCIRCGGTERYLVGTKQCVACKRKSRSLWHKANPGSRGVYNKEKACLAAQRNYYSSKYGISRLNYMAMLFEQSNRCDICKEVQTERALAVDHCHATGKVRALLCIRCNAALGSFRDRIDLLKAGIAYLERHKGEAPPV